MTRQIAGVRRLVWAHAVPVGLVVALLAVLALIFAQSYRGRVDVARNAYDGRVALHDAQTAGCLRNTADRLGDVRELRVDAAKDRVLARDPGLLAASRAASRRTGRVKQARADRKATLTAHTPGGRRRFCARVYPAAKYVAPSPFG